MRSVLTYVNLTVVVHSVLKVWVVLPPVSNDLRLWAQEPLSNSYLIPRSCEP